MLSAFQHAATDGGRAKRVLDDHCIRGKSADLRGAIGSDYVDGVIIAYCLLAMALLTGAALRPEPAWRLILAGGAIACLIYVNFFWVSLTPLLLLQYVVLAWLWRQRSAGRSIAHVCTWCGVGFLALTLACPIRLTGRHDLVLCSFSSKSHIRDAGQSVVSESLDESGSCPLALVHRGCRAYGHGSGSVSLAPAGVRVSAQSCSFPPHNCSLP